VEISKPGFAKYIFVCENKKDSEESCCGTKGSEALRETLKKRVKQMGLSDRIRVSRAGCLDACEEGPNILLMPDQIWFKKVKPEDLEEILRRAASEV